MTTLSAEELEALEWCIQRASDTSVPAVDDNSLIDSARSALAKLKQPQAVGAVAWVSIQPDQVHWTEQKWIADSWKAKGWNVIDYYAPPKRRPPQAR